MSNPRGENSPGGETGEPCKNMFFSLNCVWGLNHLILPLFCLFYETQMFFFFLRFRKRGALLSKLRSEMMQIKVSNCGFWNFFPSNPATDSTTACNRKKKKTRLSAWFFLWTKEVKGFIEPDYLKSSSQNGLVGSYFHSDQNYFAFTF